MKNIIKGFLVTLSLVFMACSAQAAIEVGQIAPEFTVAATDGESYSLSQFRGQYVVLEWLNHDCPFVKKHYNSSNMQSLQKKYGEKNVVWLSINSSGHGKQGHYHPDEANQLTAEKGASPQAVLMDFNGYVGNLYGAQTTPHMFIIDPNGFLIYQGAIDNIPSANLSDVATAQNYVQAALDQALSGQPVSTPTTKAYGCSVKYE